MPDPARCPKLGRARLRTAVLVFALSPACVPDVDDDLARIDEPRILAVRATPAEADLTKGGAAVTLEALVASRDGDVEPVSFRACQDRKPLTELGPVSPACLDPAAPEDVAPPLGTGQAVELTLGTDACTLFGPLLPPPEDGEPSGRAVDPDPTGGYYQPVVAFLDPAEASLGAVRIGCGLLNVGGEQIAQYNQRYRRNENPGIDELSLTFAGGSVKAPPDDGASPPSEVSAGNLVTLRAAWTHCPTVPECGDGICGPTEVNTPSSCAADCANPVGCTGSETYAWFDPGTREVVDRREGIALSWYATAGEFAARRTGLTESERDVGYSETKWRAPPVAGEVRLWVVIRDDRGGASWQRYRLEVTE